MKAELHLKRESIADLRYNVGLYAAYSKLYKSLYPIPLEGYSCPKVPDPLHR